ncbi:MAG: signal peptidase I [Lachnospiraceae bacterium]|nr:signal peptidase I [Lachnospiraceae bacterium]
MKKLWEIIKDIFFVLVVIAMCGMIIAVSKGYRPSIGGYQLLRVLTHSMSPAIEENALIIIKEVPQGEIQVGDIITFVSDDPDMMGFYNTHRVNSIEINQETGEKRYITKGDKNTSVDLYPVSYEQIAGKLYYKVPFGQIVGQAIAALTNQKVYFFVVMLPLMLCFVSYIWQIFKLMVFDDKKEGEEHEEA